MITFVARAWRFLAGAVLAFTLQPGAQAGLVSGSWDPQFGSALPNLSWQVRADWLVSDACTASDGFHGTGASDPCAGTRLLAFWVRWFNTSEADPGNFFQMDWDTRTKTAHYGNCASDYAASNLEPGCNLSQIGPSGPLNISSFNPGGGEPFTASLVRVVNGQVAGFNTNWLASGITVYNWPTSAGYHDFNLRFTTNGPIFACYDNVQTPSGNTSCSGEGGATAESPDLQQFLVTYSGDNFSKDRPVGNGLRLNSQGQVIPEPPVLLLALIALGAIGASRRRFA